MHVPLHSLAHRAPPATRTRVRWQPYNALPCSSSASISSRSPPHSYLNTPTSSVSSPPQQVTPVPAFDSDRLKPTTPAPVAPNTKDIKNKYAAGLVDQAVKSLSDIWHTQDIPSVFLNSHPTGSSSSGPELVSTPPPPPPTVQKMGKPHHHHHHNRNTQLPSPVSPTTQPSPTTPHSGASHLPSAATVQQCDPEPTCMFGARSTLVPIRGFVHEVLRRSRTSGSVLQTALCYLEAIRPKVPELLELEKSGQPSHVEVASDDRITLATEDEIAFYSDTSNNDVSATTADDAMNTVRVSDSDSSAEFSANSSDLLKKPKGPSAPLTPLPPLPSPLLCPRRAFLASLILASKFTQDKCYSNRAWAKLSGLPPREIGRCERALGDALDWRLWVGKSSAPPQSASLPVPAPVARTLARSRSEANLCKPSKAQFLYSEDTIAEGSSGQAPAPIRAKFGAGLRRCSTLPADVFASQEAQQSKQMVAACAAAASYPQNITIDHIDTHVDILLSSDEIDQLQQLDHRMRSPDINVTMSYGLQTQHAAEPDIPNHNGNINDTTVCPPTELIDQTIPSFSSTSPTPLTPALSYSPSSTESSSGERTIQMSTFPDDNMVPSGPIGSSGTDVWPWLEATSQSSTNISPSAITVGGPFAFSKALPPPHFTGAFEYINPSSYTQDGGLQFHPSIGGGAGYCANNSRNGIPMGGGQKVLDDVGIGFWGGRDLSLSSEGSVSL